jgi:hypothetical protein
MALSGNPFSIVGDRGSTLASPLAVRCGPFVATDCSPPWSVDLPICRASSSARAGMKGLEPHAGSGGSLQVSGNPTGDEAGAGISPVKAATRHYVPLHRGTADMACVRHLGLSLAPEEHWTGIDSCR